MNAGNVQSVVSCVECTHRGCVCVCFPGYAFLLFQEESSVQALIEACMEEDGKLYLCVSSPTIKDKPVSSAAEAHAERRQCFHLLS